MHTNVHVFTHISIYSHLLVFTFAHTLTVRNLTGHNRLTRVYMRVQRSRITRYRHKAENTETQDFNVENPNREKPWRSTNPRNRITIRRGSTIRYSEAMTSRPSSSNCRGTHSYTRTLSLLHSYRGNYRLSNFTTTIHKLCPSCLYTKTNFWLFTSIAHKEHI